MLATLPYYFNINICYNFDRTTAEHKHQVGPSGTVIPSRLEVLPTSLLFLHSTTHASY